MVKYSIPLIVEKVEEFDEHEDALVTCFRAQCPSFTGRYKRCLERKGKTPQEAISNILTEIKEEYIDSIILCKIENECTNEQIYNVADKLNALRGNYSFWREIITARKEHLDEFGIPISKDESYFKHDGQFPYKRDLKLSEYSLQKMSEILFEDSNLLQKLADYLKYPHFPSDVDNSSLSQEEKRSRILKLIEEDTN